MIIFLLYLLLCPVPVSADEVFHALIAEVSPFGERDWTEVLVLSGTGSTAELMLTDLDGIDTSLSEGQGSLHPADRFVVHWDTGIDEIDDIGDFNANGIRDFYVADTNMSSTDDQAVLIRKGEIIDSVVWTNDDGDIPAAELADVKYLNDHEAWPLMLTQSGAVVLGESTSSIARTEKMPDTNTENDWSIFESPTQGLENIIAPIPEPERDEDEADVEPINEFDEADGPLEEILYDYSNKIIVSEFLPNPIGDDAAGEFIELFNADEALSLRGWKIRDADANSYELDNITIGSGKYLLLPRSLTKIALNNDAESIALYDPDDEQISVLSFEDSITEGESVIVISGEEKITQTPTPGSLNILTELAIETDEVSVDEENFTEEDPVAADEKSEAVPTIAVSELRTLAEGTQVQTEGVVSAASDILGSGIFYISASTSGIQIYLPGTSVREGDRVRLTGVLASYRGERRVKATAVQEIGSGDEPIPFHVQSEDITESIEGSLVRVEDVLSRSAGDTFYLGDSEIKVAIKASTGIQKPTMKKGDDLIVVGILSEVDGTYRVLPRRVSDITVQSVVTTSVSKATAKSRSTKASKKTNAEAMAAIVPLTAEEADTLFADEPYTERSPYFWFILAGLGSLVPIGYYTWNRYRSRTHADEISIDITE